MIVSNNNGAWLKPAHQELFHIVLRRLIGKSISKRNNDEMIHTQLADEFDPFIQCIDQTDTQYGRRNNLAGVGMKSNDDRFATGSFCFSFQFINDLAVAQV